MSQPDPLVAMNGLVSAVDTGGGSPKEGSLRAGSNLGGELDARLAAAQARVRSWKRIRAFWRIVAICLLGGLIFDFVERGALTPPVAGLLAGLMSIALLVAVGANLFSEGSVGESEQDAEALCAKRRILDRPVKDGLTAESTTEHFSRLVDISLVNLENYYALVRSHASKSFVASITVGGLGFFLIVAGLVLGFLNAPNGQTLSYISAGSGVLTEFIAGVFFYLHARSATQMKAYYRELIEVQNVLFAFKIASYLPEGNAKTQMVGEIFAYVLNKRGTVVP